MSEETNAISSNIEKLVADAMDPKKSIGRELLEFVVAVIIQTLYSAVLLGLTFELILPLADGFYAMESSFRDYLVFGLATVPLRLILK